MTAHECLTAYNRLTSRFFDGRRCFPRKATKNALREAEVYLLFCKSKDIHPIRFMLSRHEASGWKGRIPLSRMAAVAASFIENFVEWGDGHQAQIQDDERLAQRVEIDTDRRTKMTVLGEQAKAAFSTTPEVCILSQDITLGWHPASFWCRECELAESCREGLPAKVVEARHAGCG